MFYFCFYLPRILNYFQKFNINVIICLLCVLFLLEITNSLPKITNWSNTYFSTKGSLAMPNGSFVNNLYASFMYMWPNRRGTCKRHSNAQVRIQFKTINNIEWILKSEVNPFTWGDPPLIYWPNWSLGLWGCMFQLPAR